MINRTWMKRTGVVLLIILMLAFLGFLLLQDNIHTVVSGEVYRSAQLPPSHLRQWAQAHDIRSIINLRGSNPNYRWYQDETYISQVMGIKHYDVRLSSTQKPRPRQLRRLVYLLQNAPKPILLHCEGGADRTGFAAAMFLLLKGRSIAEARHQFSWVYHVRSARSVGKLVLPYYVAWLKKHGFKSSNRAHFLRWVATAQLAR